MNILSIKHYFVGFMVSEIPRVIIFGYFLIYQYVSFSVIALKKGNRKFIWITIMARKNSKST